MQFIQSLWGPSGLILLGAIFGAIGAFWSAHQQSTINDELSAKSGQIVGLTERISTQSKTIEDKTNIIISKSELLEVKSLELDEKNNIIIDKAEVIASLNKELLNHTTGGDSFPVIDFPSIDPTKNSGMILIHNSSDKYMLYDLQVRISDFASEFVKTNENPIGDDEIINAGNIPAMTDYTGGVVTLNNAHSKNFKIFSQSRQGSFIQQLRLRKVNGIWRQAIKVVERRTNKILYTRIDPEYPVEHTGEVVWGE
ncbi:hypothetical protein F0248_02365 [Vibrio crassostreae]|uniref:hypothetical protein n=1 Tax=Vibrio crassostreae TaxID=246167 RepID=UPI000F47DF57|nr:hypothetical protein [Vibrio crassostreae]NOH78035.1 hypothetical protein [Vibrio crassostreae]NOI51926.1 hypothetical protein [Vibrio crassostreae]ROR11088.1 hypothetical protein EDB36_111113 [Vibrio crassostreae]CAK1722372.1 conserved hypothetical protein [Vibrio crassostreae]CAK2233861.1 conserved hypothetical protein [Vibrio crassostreae]